ncbi:hypothetical protein BT96DRAFT_936760 [Gymnopus androsaceus JB14]|uniref:Uncharacterized protein n=1 Tax=Gymnopus androsaceus JB14 TaxID=1447944 RepID=A0A6A4I2N2_9AGAR|nr:hypothetical protein BT96DRAFT_936760 [Gymnopus androsaceus JB14]
MFYWHLQFLFEGLQDGQDQPEELGSEGQKVDQDSIYRSKLNSMGDLADSNEEDIPIHCWSLKHPRHSKGSLEVDSNDANSTLFDDNNDDEDEEYRPLHCLKHRHSTDNSSNQEPDIGHQAKAKVKPKPRGKAKGKLPAEWRDVGQQAKVKPRPRGKSQGKRPSEWRGIGASDRSAEDNADDDKDIPSNNPLMVKGPLPKSIKNQIDTAHAKLKAEIAEIAHKSGHELQSCYNYLDANNQVPRAANCFNIFQIWYRVHSKKCCNPGVTASRWTKIEQFERYKTNMENFIEEKKKGKMLKRFILRQAIILVDLHALVWDPNKLQLTQFVKNAWEFHVCIVNWPLEGKDIEDPGDCVEMVSWDKEEINLPIKDQLNIALVTDTKGNVVIAVSNLPMHQAAMGTEEDQEEEGDQGDKDPTLSLSTSGSSFLGSTFNPNCFSTKTSSSRTFMHISDPIRFPSKTIAHISSSKQTVCCSSITTTSCFTCFSTAER